MAGGAYDEQIKAMRDAGLSYAKIADALSIPQSTVATASRRLFGKVTDEQREAKRNAGIRRRLAERGEPHGIRARWTEEALTETWAERKLRRQIEKGRELEQDH